MFGVTFEKLVGEKTQILWLLYDVSITQDDHYMTSEKREVVKRQT